MDQTTNHDFPTVLWYIVGIIVVIAVAAWYFYGKQTPATNTQPTVVEQTQSQTQTSGQASGNTTVDISTELNQIPDTASALDADAAMVANDLQSI